MLLSPPPCFVLPMCWLFIDGKISALGFGNVYSPEAWLEITRIGLCNKRKVF